MLNSQGFDKWAGDYDQQISEFDKGYPFEGYYQVLSYVSHLIEKRATNEGYGTILDLGIGTGLLTKELYKKGFKITGLDFSPKMLELAQQKMPQAELYCFNFKDGLPKELRQAKFHYIVSSYALHHIDDQAKLDLLSELYQNHLHEQGKLIVADVAFQTSRDLQHCQQATGAAWDHDEYYIVADSFQKELQARGLKCSYTQLSPCAGVLEIGKD